MLSGLTRITKSGKGRLITVPPSEEEFEVEFKIYIDSRPKDPRTSLPSTQTTVSFLESVDHRPIPLGPYRLLIGNESLPVKNVGNA